MFAYTFTCESSLHMQTVSVEHVSTHVQNKPDFLIKYKATVVFYIISKIAYYQVYVL